MDGQLFYTYTWVRLNGLLLHTWLFFFSMAIGIHGLAHHTLHFSYSCVNLLFRLKKRNPRATFVLKNSCPWWPKCWWRGGQGYFSFRNHSFSKLVEVCLHLSFKGVKSVKWFSMKKKNVKKLKSSANVIFTTFCGHKTGQQWFSVLVLHVYLYPALVDGMSALSELTRFWWFWSHNARHCCLYRYKPVPEDQIVKAFQVLDVEGRGYLTQEELSKYMTEEGWFDTNPAWQIKIYSCIQVQVLNLQQSTCPV